MWDFPLFPEQASTVAGKVDAVYLFIVGVMAFFTLLIFVLVVYFAIKYHRGRVVDRSNPPASSHMMEAIWIIVPLAIALVIFGWSTSVYFEVIRPPSDAITYHAIAKQWMWKFQSPDGKREVNELHVPVGQPINIMMTSQDVIHSLFVPAFRIKSDVLPGRYTNVWFEATKPGTYHLFCTEYCGTQHSMMIGRVIAMQPRDYEAWLAGGGSSETPAQAGARLFTQFGCNTCHGESAGSRGPSLAGIYGREIRLQSGETVTANDNYIRESIYTPTSQVVAGYQPIMPTYKGQLSEDDVMQIVAYIKSIGAEGSTATETPGAAPSRAVPSGTVPATRASETTTPNTTSTAN